MKPFDAAAKAAVMQAWPFGQPAAKGAAPPAKRQRGCGGVGPWTERQQHGVSLSDHGEKATWAGYWEERERKLQTQAPDAGLYGALASRLAGEAAVSVELPTPGIFRRCCIYFNGRVDAGGGLSAFALGKLARLHGAEVVPRLTMGRTTHVVCTQLSGSKELQALKRAASRASKGQYYVLPQWIAQSVAAGRRLCERRFSVLAKVACDVRLAAPQVLLAAAHVTGEGPRERAASSPVRKDVAVPVASPRARQPPAGAAVLVEDSQDSLLALESDDAVAATAPDGDDDEAPPTELDDSDEE